MKVYIIMEDDWESNEVLEVHEDEDLAMKRLEELESNRKAGSCSYRIEDHDIISSAVQKASLGGESDDKR